jgi:peptide deformylase
MTGKGILARALQHEIDHLDGVLFIRRVAPAKS